MNPDKEILMIAGEVSGDAHGGRLVQALKEVAPDVGVFGIGGDEMSAAGMEVMIHVREMAFLGFSEVIRHLPFVRRVFNRLKEALRERKPAAVVLVDYPGFNLRFARTAKKMGYPVVYYVSPQVWAWGRWRMRKIARSVDQMLVVFPFEKALYEEAGVPVEFVGHPLLESLDSTTSRGEFIASLGLDESALTVGLLPGSRIQEVERLLPVMAGAAEILKRDFPSLQVLVAAPPTLPEHIYTKFLTQNTLLVHGRTSQVMRHSDLLLVASGTATLESACYRTPLIVVYKVSRLSWLLGNLLVSIDHVALANIVAEEKIVPELLQGDATPERVAEAALPLLESRERRAAFSKKFAVVTERLGTPGASMRAAKLILQRAEIPD